ncbi:hypothetical protein P7K49_032603 [Saguinus oedipus]|uniref:Uncharacterized protein n=1 Tax=Saguinus oedipus TaxID=9490 RepID=A0ABQ9TYP7_SAGOE|nr:hypothetical protein P7K49_032603 [Saguinus oedipus]
MLREGSLGRVATAATLFSPATGTGRGGKVKVRERGGRRTRREQDSWQPDGCLASWSFGGNSGASGPSGLGIQGKPADPRLCLEE